MRFAALCAMRIGIFEQNISWRDRHVSVLAAGNGQKGGIPGFGLLRAQ